VGGVSVTGVARGGGVSVTGVARVGGVSVTGVAREGEVWWRRSACVRRCAPSIWHGDGTMHETQHAQHMWQDVGDSGGAAHTETDVG
jgi:hypothetical protein